MAENNNINAGVQTNVGMEFQKHCAVYIFLDKYDEIKDKKYFIMLEHYEDIIFGFLDGDELSKIETYQAKKSTNKWTLSGLVEIIKKITTLSQEILDDPHKRTDDFKQENNFATNNTIEFSVQIKKKKIKDVVNEENDTRNYRDLDKEIKTKILSGNDDVEFNNTDKERIEELTFRFIDLGRTPKAQIQLLHGKLADVFGDKISDHRAALETLLSYLKEIESIFNQGGKAVLSDRSKRLESEKLNEILEVITTKKLAFDFWREKADDICVGLNIAVSDRGDFEFHFDSSFDLFKDLSSTEHRKVYAFINENTDIYGNHALDIECIKDFLAGFKRNKSTTLTDIQLKAAISAAYLIIRDIA